MLEALLGVRWQDDPHVQSGGSGSGEYHYWGKTLGLGCITEIKK